MIAINKGESFTIAIRLSDPNLVSDIESIVSYHNSGATWFQPSPFDDNGIAFIRLSANQTLGLGETKFIYFVIESKTKGQRVTKRFPVSISNAHSSGSNSVNEGIDFVIEILDPEYVGIETWVAGYVKGERGAKGDKGDQGSPGQRGQKGSSITGIRIAGNNLIFDFDGGLPPQSVIVPAIQAANDAAAAAAGSASDANAHKLAAAQSSIQASGYAASAQNSAFSAEESKNIAVNNATVSVGARDVAIQKSQETSDLRDETEGYRDEVLNLKSGIEGNAATATSAAATAVSAKDTALQAKDDTLAAKNAVDQQAATVATNTQTTTQKAQEASTSAQEALTSKNQAQGIKTDVEAIAQAVDQDRVTVEQAKVSVDASVVAVDQDAQQVAADKALIQQLTLENQALRAENQILTDLSRDYNTQSANNAISAIQTNIGGTNGIDNILPVAQLMPGMGLNGVNFSVVRTGTAATNFNLRGMLERALPNRPRFDYDPVSGNALGVLVEGEGIEYSRGFGNMSTTYFFNFISGTGITPVRTLKSVTNRFGVANACDRVFLDRGTGDLTSDQSLISQDLINLPAGNYTATFWARTNNSTNEIIRIRFPWADINITLTPNWQFYSFSGNNPSVGNRSLSFGIRGTFTSRTADFSVDEIRLIPTAQSSFRPILNFQTTQNALTRPADNLTQTTTSWNQSEGTIIAHVRPNTKPHQSIFVASDGAPVQMVANGDDLNTLTFGQNGTGLLPVVTPKSGTDRFGNANSVDRVFFDFGSGASAGSDQSRITVRSQNVPQIGTYEISYWARSATGTNQVIRTRRGVDGTTDSNQTITPTWQRFSVLVNYSVINLLEFTFSTRGTLTPQTCDIFLSEVSIRRVSDELRLQADGTLTFTRSGVTQTLSLGGSLNTFSSYAISYAPNRVAACRNGGTVQEITTAGNINVTNISYAADVVGASKHVFAQYFARAMSNLSMQGKTGDFKYGQDPGDFTLNQNLGELAFHNFQNILAMGIADQTLRIRGTGSNVVETVSRDYPFEVITLFTSGSFTTRSITGMDATLGYFPANSVATLTFNAASNVVWDVAIRPRLTP